MGPVDGRQPRRQLALIRFADGRFKAMSAPIALLGSALAWIHRRGEACGVGASTRKAS